MFESAIPVIRVSDSTVAEAFYCNALGFRVSASWRPDEANADPCYMTLVRDGARLHVHSFQSGAMGASAVYVFVDDVDSLYAELIAKGVPVGAPLDQTWGTREIGVRDTDRNIVTFGERRPIT
jgi:uncharacterized glyoxalase superfamily protein PhnB